jgi:hypothetical protein
MAWMSPTVVACAFTKSWGNAVRHAASACCWADSAAPEAFNGGGQGAFGGHLGGTTVVVLSASLGCVVVLAECSCDALQAARITRATTARADFTPI